MAKTTKLQDIKKNQSLAVGSKLKSLTSRIKHEIEVTKIDKTPNGTFVRFNRNDEFVIYGIEALFQNYELID